MPRNFVFEPQVYSRNQHNIKNMDPRLGSIISYLFFRLDFFSRVPPHVFVADCYRF